MIRNAKLVLFLFFANFVYSAFLSAGEFKEWLKRTNGEHYQQPSFQMVDPKGDAFLIRKLDQVPMRLLEALVKSSYPQDEIEKERELAEIEVKEKRPEPNSVQFQIGRTHPINVTRLINKIHEVIRSYPQITPQIGKEHKWSPEAQRYLFYGFWHRLGWFITHKQNEFPSPLFLRSKLFLLLACGWTSRYALTGREDALETRLMGFQDRTVQIHDLFRESYLLNNGNLYLTLLTAENILAKDPYRTDRDNSSLQKKLAYIRNDSKQMGDNYGAWYHFFGIGLYGMSRSTVVSRAVAEIESLGSLFLEGPDKQEDYINRLGAVWGRKLNKLITNKDYLKPLNSDDRTDYILFPAKQ